MTEDSDKAAELSKQSEASEVLLHGEVIKNESHQSDWQTTQRVHILGQDESATDMFYISGASKSTTEKFELFDSTQEPILLATNSGSSATDYESWARASADEENLSKQQIAQSFSYDGRPPTLLCPDLDPVGLIGDKFKRVIEHHYRGDEQEMLASIPQQAWSDAYSAFPELASAAHLSKKDSCRLMKAILANELEHYDKWDLAEDILVGAKGQDLLYDKTVGWSQISVFGVRGYLAELQKEVSEGKRKDNPLAKYVGKTDAQLLEVLQDSKALPLFVAANLAHNVRMYARHGYPVTIETLGYGFNPDLADSSDALKHSLLPTSEELKKSVHVRNVLRWFNKFQD